MVKFSSHQQYYNERGEEVPSVTTILKMLNKGALVGWANFMGFKRINVKDVLETSSEIGTIVHEYIECILRDEIYPSSKMNKYVQKHGNDLYQRLLFVNNWFAKDKPELEPVYIEEKLVSEDYGGTVDFYGLYNGKKTILDFKTSSRPYASMYLQLSGYMEMIEGKGHEVEQAGIVIIKKDEPIKVHLVPKEILDEFRVSFNLLKEFHKSWHNQSQEKYWKWGNIYD